MSMKLKFDESDVEYINRLFTAQLEALSVLKDGQSSNNEQVRLLVKEQKAGAATAEQMLGEIKKLIERVALATEEVAAATPSWHTSPQFLALRRQAEEAELKVRIAQLEKVEMGAEAEALEAANRLRTAKLAASRLSREEEVEKGQLAELGRQLNAARIALEATRKELGETNAKLQKKQFPVKVIPPTAG